MKPGIVVYVTKYAFSRGIIKTTLADNPWLSTSSSLLVVVVSGAIGKRLVVQKDDVHATLEEAMAKAELMREKKLKSLYSQIYRLRHKKIAVKVDPALGSSE